MEKSVGNDKTYPCLRTCPGTIFVDKFNKDLVDNLKQNQNKN